MARLAEWFCGQILVWSIASFNFVRATRRNGTRIPGGSHPSLRWPTLENGHTHSFPPPSYRFQFSFFFQHRRLFHSVTDSIKPFRCSIRRIERIRWEDEAERYNPCRRPMRKQLNNEVLRPPGGVYFPRDTGRSIVPNANIFHPRDHKASKSRQPRDTSSAN